MPNPVFKHCEIIGKSTSQIVLHANDAQNTLLKEAVSKLYLKLPILVSCVTMLLFHCEKP